MKSNWISPFIEGLKSVVSVSGIVKGVVSSSVAEGVENGFHRITPRLVKLFTISTLLLIGLLMFALGLSNALENILNITGLGHVIIGIAFIVTGALYYAFNRL